MAEPAAAAAGRPAGLTADQRHARWLRTYDPVVLWPESSPHQRIAGYGAILNAVEQVLAGKAASLTAGSPAEVHASGIAAFLAGVGPLLGWWIERGKLTATPGLSRLFAEHLAQGRARAVLMRERVARIVEGLAHHGVTPVLLKGGVTAYRYFVDPGTRPTGDIDLLVSPGERRATNQVLEKIGLRLVGRHA